MANVSKRRRHKMLPLGCTPVPLLKRARTNVSELEIDDQVKQAQCALDAAKLARTNWYVHYYKAIVANSNVRRARTTDIDGLNRAACIVENFNVGEPCDRIRSNYNGLDVVRNDDTYDFDLKGLFGHVNNDINITRVKTRWHMVSVMVAAGRLRALYYGCHTRGSVLRQKKSDKINAIVKDLVIDPNDDIKTACRLVHAMSTFTSVPEVSSALLAVAMKKMIPFEIQTRILELAYEFDNPIGVCPLAFLTALGSSIVTAEPAVFRGAAYVQIFADGHAPLETSQFFGLHRVANNGIDVDTMCHLY